MVLGTELARKAVAFAVVPILAMTLMGCGGGGGPTPAPTPATPAPTSPPTAPTPAPTPKGKGCLCIFDIDRTLTGRQDMGNTGACSKNTVQPGIQDVAYTQGTLALSELGEHVEKSGCNECYMGVISAGGPTGPEKGKLFEHLTVNGKMPDGVTSMDAWHTCEAPGGVATKASGPFFTLCHDGIKQKTVPFLKKWYESKDIYIDDEEVYFFDDRESNVSPFDTDNPYNAKQISCATRDSKIDGVGLCGAQLSEITLDKGKTLCPKTSMSEELV